jgi:hypothetical protein
VAFFSWLIRRWWFWIAVVLCAPLFLALVLRLTGMLEVRREVARLQAAGVDLPWQQRVARGLPVDAALEVRLVRWAEATVAEVDDAASVPSTLGDLWRLPVVGEYPAPDPAPPLVSPVSEPRLAELGAILASGPVWWGPLGAVRALPGQATALAEPVAADETTEVTQERQSDLQWLAVLAARGFVAQILAERAQCDPRQVQAAPAAPQAAPAMPAAPIAQPAAPTARHAAAVARIAVLLRHLDQLAATMPAVWNREQVTNASELAALRDALYLRLSADDLLTGAQREAWLRETIDAPRLMSQALRNEAATGLPELAQWHTLWWWQPPAAWVWGDLSWMWVDPVLLPHLAARTMRRHAAVAEVLERGTAADFAAQPEVHPWLLGASLLRHSTDPLQLAEGSLITQQRHRLLRTAAQVVAAWRHGGLPADFAPEQAAPGSPDARLLPTLTYQRLSPTRFRLDIDAATLLPGVALNGPATWSFVRAGGATWIHDGDWSLELDCDVLLPFHLNQSEDTR